MNAYLYKDKNTVLIDIDKSTTGLTTVEQFARENGFVEKDTVHATIVGFSAGVKISTLLKDSANQDMLGKIESLVTETDWSPQYLNEFFVVSKEYEFFDPKIKSKVKSLRQSIIQKIVLPELETFYEKLNTITGLAFPVQFPHITLYTKGDASSAMGIGINSIAEFESLSHEKITI